MSSRPPAPSRPAPRPARGDGGDREHGDRFRISVVGPVHPLRGGIAHHTTLLVRALATRHDVQVMSFRRQYPALLYPGRTDRDPSRRPLDLPVEPRYRLDPLYPWTWAAAAREISRFAPDAVVLQWWTTFWAPALAALAALLRRRGVRVLFLVHNVLPHEPRRWDPWLGRLALARGHGFIVQAERERVRLHALVPGAHVLVCEHPVYGMLAEAPPTRAEARALLGLPAHGLVVLFFGIVRPYKGLPHLVDAIALLHRRGERAHLVVAGEFWEDRRAYERQIAGLGLTDRVRLIDRYVPNEEVGALFAAADVLAAPYMGGTQSGVVKMAMGFGLPVIATEHAHPASAGADGLSVPAGDAPALADAIALVARRERDPLPARPSPGKSPDGWHALVDAIEDCVTARDR